MFSYQYNIFVFRMIFLTVLYNQSVTPGIYDVYKTLEYTI